MKVWKFALSLALLFILSSCSSSSNSEKKVTKENIVQSVSKILNNSQSKSDVIDLSGIFYSSSAEPAEIKSTGKNKWEISYVTQDGKVKANFETKWKKLDHLSQSISKMKKSDGYTGFKITIEYKNPEEITATISNGNANKMVFTKQKPKIDEKYANVLNGDLSAFEGQFSTDAFNRTIADSKFTYGGYNPEDYYNNRTSVFPTISKNGYWNGITSHGNFEVRASDLPKQVNGYYEVHVYGTNFGANNATLTFFLVPPKVKGPDGTTSDEKRVFQEYADGKPHLLEYLQPQWWRKYQITTSTSSSPWSPEKTEQLKSMMASWEQSMGQSYETFSLDTKEPAELFNFWNVSLDDSITTLTKSITGDEGAVNVVAYYSEKPPIPSNYPIRYIFVIKDGEPNVYVSRQSQGNPENIYYWTTTQNTDLKQRFADLVYQQ